MNFHRAVAGDKEAGLHPADFENELPVIALTCVDPRLNAYFPNALALPAEDFIWLRNAGNIITGPLSSTMRSLALACAVKGGKEIAILSPAPFPSLPNKIFAWAAYILGSRNKGKSRPCS